MDSVLHFPETELWQDPARPDLKREIARREDVEQSLRLSEERFRALYEENPLILITVDEQGTVLSINRRGADHIGFDAGELIGSSLLNLVMEEDRSELHDVSGKDPQRVRQMADQWRDIAESTCVFPLDGRKWEERTKAFGNP